MIADLFGAGLDTTLTTMKWALVYLASYPELQTIIRQEMAQNDLTNNLKLFHHEAELPKTSVSS